MFTESVSEDYVYSLYDQLWCARLGEEDTMILCTHMFIKNHLFHLSLTLNALGSAKVECMWRLLIHFWEMKFYLST